MTVKHSQVDIHVGQVLRDGDIDAIITKTFADLGLSDRIASASGDVIKFKPQTYIYYNGKPYEVTGYNTTKEGTGRFSDKSRNGYLRGIDLSTGKEVVIKGNTFVSDRDSAATTGQLYAIRGRVGGDFNYDSKWISGNTFLFTGALRAYPSSLGATPCSFAYDNTVSVTCYDVMGWNGNLNSKMEQPALDQTFAAGNPRFLGFATAAPGAGSYRQGDFYLFSNVAAGGFIGTINTTTGSPGTWKSFGAIAP